jgi:hypothetical protein
VPVLQTSSQVVAFLSGHLGFPFPSPVLFRQLGDRFRRAVLSFADANDISWVKFGKDEAKLAVMTPYLARQAASGCSQVAAIGVAQEFQRVWTAYQRDTKTAAPQFTFAKADRRVTCYYFYLWDADFGLPSSSSATALCNRTLLPRSGRRLMALLGYASQSPVHLCLPRPRVSNSSRPSSAWTPSARSATLIAMPGRPAGW